MSRYPEVPLGEVLAQERRPVDVDPTATYEEIGIRSFGKGIFHKPPVSGADIGSKKIFEIYPGDFVLSIVFAWEGAIAVAGNAEKGRVASHRFPTYVPTADRLDARYLRAYLLADEGQRLLGEASPGSAGRNRTLNRAAFADMVIPLPPLDQQRRLANRLDAIAQQVAAVRERQELATTLDSGLLGSLLGSLRESTPSVPLGEILTQVRDEVEVEPDQTYRPAGIFSFGRGLFARPVIQGADTKYKKFNRLTRDQVTYSKLGGWEGAVTVTGPDAEDLVVSAEYPTFDIDSRRADPAYLRLIARWPSFWERLRTRGSMARRKRTSPSHFLAIEIPLPPLDEQRRLGAMGARLHDFSVRRERARETLDALIPATINQALASPG